MRLGYNTWSMATVPYQVFIPRLAAIGYTAVAISVVPSYPIGGRRVPNATDLDVLTTADLRQIRTELEARELLLAAIVGNQPIIEDDPDRSARFLARLRRTIDCCVELAPRGQPLPVMNTGSGGRPEDREGHRQQLVDRLGELAAYAAQRGVTVCLEPRVGAAIDSPERAQWVVEAVNHPHFALDFDISHFEVAGYPMEAVVPRLAPLARSVEIKDQTVRYLDEPAPPGWRIEGNGVGQATAPDGRPLEFQFLLGGEGDFDLPKFLRLLQQAGWNGPVGFEASVACQARPGYDALAAAEQTYRWMRAGWEAAGVPVT